MPNESVRLTPPIAAAICLSWLAAAPASMADEVNPVQIDEWEVPYQGRARDPFAAGSDEIWFVGQRGHYLARFTPSTGEFFKRDLPDNAGPHNLIVGSDGIVWYAGNLMNYIGRYDPQTDVITKIPMPDRAARDPHTLVFDDGERHIWFTVQGGNFVGRLTLADQSVDLIPVPTQRARPYGIKIAADGTPWIVLLGTNKLASVNPETLQLTEHEIPADGARPRRLEITSDGRIWYADAARGFIGVYDPESSAFEEWALPSGDRAQAYGMASDEHDRVWVVEAGASPNQLVGFDTRSEEVFSVTAIPSGAGAVRHMHYHMPTASIWFGTDEETLGRAVVPPAN
jgi:virginiamycin B lyase